jgi:hypothetical protein
MIKDPRSAEYYAFDFTYLLAADDTIATVTSVTIDVTDDEDTKLTVGAGAINGDLVVVFLSAGTPDYTYQVRAEVVTAGGETLNLTMIVLIRTKV